MLLETACVGRLGCESGARRDLRLLCVRKRGASLDADLNVLRVGLLRQVEHVRREERLAVRLPAARRAPHTVQMRRSHRANGRSGVVARAA
eukprot:6317535-Prymnesium_polylepis.2